MARHDAGPKSTKLYRAVVVCKWWHQYNQAWIDKVEYFGPYTKPAPAKAIITREISLMETQNRRDQLRGNPPTYRDIASSLEVTDLNWQPVP